MSAQAGADLGPGSELAWTQGWTPRKVKGWEQRLRTEAAGMERGKGRGAYWLRGRVSGEWEGSGCPQAEGLGFWGVERVEVPTG